LIYYGGPNSSGTLDLWSMPVTLAQTPPRAVQRTHFTRDTYAPSAMSDGGALFKRQEYRTFVAAVAPKAGPSHR